MHRYRSKVVLAAAATVLAMVGPGYTVAAEAAELPTPSQALEVFRDRWGSTDFELTGTNSWASQSSWRRVEPQYQFGPGTNEFTTQPTSAFGLKPLRLEIFQRVSEGEQQYQILEEALEPDGTTTFNYFPVFRGTPQSMVFYNSVGVHQTLAAEIEERCRDYAKQARHFQLCRVIRQDGWVAYHVKVRDGEPATNLPTATEVLNAFRDQWGQASFQPTGVSGWMPDVTWRAAQGLVFDAGETELTGQPTTVTPGDPGISNVDWLFQRRTVTGAPDQHQVIQKSNGGERIDYFPPLFRGTAQRAVFQFENSATFPDPRTNEREETRVLQHNGEEFLITRVVHANGRLNYWISCKVEE